jgi:sugar O-acyltransferase (sialic acid O-acetyltransferase NeuD family)
MNENKQKLIIVGAGPQGQIAKDFFLKHSSHNLVGFASHKDHCTESIVHGYPHYPLEELSNTHPPSEFKLFVAIGYRKMNKIRQSVYEELKRLGYEFASFIHPSASVSESAIIGENVFIFEDNTIQPYVKIGNNTVLWSGNHIGHHSSIGDHCFISSHVVISGFCKIFSNVFIGVNATLHDSITIAEKCLIGAGSLMTKSTNPKEVYLEKKTQLFPKSSEQIKF